MAVHAKKDAGVIIMPGDNTGLRVGYLAGRFPGRIGHLLSPRPRRKPPGPFELDRGEFLPVALDNGAYAAGEAWVEDDWIRLLDWAKLTAAKPRWILVPDLWGNAKRTLERWEQYAPIAARYGWPLAFAVQDGMKPRDVPREAEVIFVGGSDPWRRETIPVWCANFPRVHIGRVNTYRRLWECHKVGAESCDGTGWFRGDHGSGRPWRSIMAYLEESSGLRTRPLQHALELAG